MDNKQDKNISDLNIPITPETKSYEVTCPNCKQQVTPVNFLCPECRHYIGEGKTVYEPISDKTAKKIRIILSIILLGIFLILVATGVVQLRACEGSSYFKRFYSLIFKFILSVKNFIY